ncbi:MAG TPA: hypothetical protein ENH62_17075 [Marinobacter sp.]|uniref:Uncharacterized protein n=1 Tax=marine sediment metagenome TaxID=412755 RepID=A0A0F9N7G9_9ZZZZ|nr:hypothetical protein [Marinobacter sp.]
MSHSLSAYFKQRLEWLGYEDMECQYSLGHCQGDGVAFYGTVELNEILLKRVLYMGPNSTATSRFKAITEYAKWLALSQFFRIEIQCIDSRYSHSGTMRVCIEVDEDDLEEAIESGSIPWVSTADETVTNLCDELESMIEDDAKQVSRLLETEGYEFADAEGLGYSEESTAYTEQRASFRVTVEIVERHDTDWDELDALIGLDSGDDLGFIHSTLKQIRDGELRVASLRAVLESIDEDGDVLSEIDYAFIGGVTYNPKTRDFGGAEEELASELFSQHKQLFASSEDEELSETSCEGVAA